MRRIEARAVARAAVARRQCIVPTQLGLQPDQVPLELRLRRLARLAADARVECAQIVADEAQALAQVLRLLGGQESRRVGNIVQQPLDVRIPVATVDVRCRDEALHVVVEDAQPDAQRLAQVARGDRGRGAVP